MKSVANPITFTLNTLSQTYLLIFLQNPFEMSLSLSKFLETYNSTDVFIQAHYDSKTAEDVERKYPLNTERYSFKLKK